MKELIGQWPHAFPDEEAPPELRSDFANVLLDWFNHWLKNDTSAPLGPNVQIEDATGHWRNETGWPAEAGLATCVATPAAGTPEVPFVPLLLLAGISGGGFVVLRRRKTRAAAAMLLTILAFCSVGAVGGFAHTASSAPPCNDADVTGPTPLYLTPTSALDFQQSSSSGSFTLAAGPAQLQDPTSSLTLPSNVQTVCQQPTCAAFTTAPMTSTFRFTGIPEVKLNVTPDGTTGDIGVFLYDLSSSGANRIGWGQVDLRFPNGWGDPATGNPPQNVTAGAPMTLDFPLQPLDTLVPQGDQLLMVLTETNTYNRLPSTPQSPVTLSVGGTQSVLNLETIEPQPSQFFTPPNLAEACCNYE